MMYLVFYQVYHVEGNCCNFVGSHLKLPLQEWCRDPVTHAFAIIFRVTKQCVYILLFVARSHVGATEQLQNYKLELLCVVYIIFLNKVIETPGISNIICI